MLAHPTFQPIVRERVVQRILNAAAYPVTLIVAPAGYGKSVALRHALERMDVPNVRFDVRPEHGTLLGFLRGFAEAFAEIAPGMSRTFADAYRSEESFETLVEWAEVHLKDYGGSIALDDFHLATDERVARFVIGAIEKTKNRIQWLIVGRERPVFPVASWMANWTMDAVIERNELSFTEEEAAHLAELSTSARTNAEISELFALTAGWPTAFMFALRSTTSMDVLTIAASARQLTYEYLAEQVYAALVPEQRAVLEFCAYLPAIHVDVLKAGGFVNARAVLEDLRSSVTFLSLIGPGIYQCHDLFRDFLRHQVEHQGDVVRVGVCKRAATALEVTGNVAAALALWQQIADENEILRLLNDHGNALIDRGYADAVGDAVAAIRNYALREQAAFIGLTAVLESFNGRFDRAETLLRRALTKCLEDHELYAALSLRLAMTLFFQRRDLADVVEPLLNDDGVSLTARVGALSFFAPSLVTSGRKDEAQSVLRQLEELLDDIDSDELRARVLQRMGIAKFWLCEPKEHVDPLFAKSYEIASSERIYSLASVALGGLGTMALFYGKDLVAAASYMKRAVEEAEKSGDRYSLQTAMLQLIDVEGMSGRYQSAKALSDRLRSLTTTDPRRSITHVPIDAMIAAGEAGNFRAAYDLASRHLLSEWSYFDSDNALVSAFAAVYAFAAGFRSQSQRITSEALNVIATSKSGYPYGNLIIECARCLCAIVEAMAGRVSKAQHILKASMAHEDDSSGTLRQVAVDIVRSVQFDLPALTTVQSSLTRLSDQGFGGVAAILEKAIIACMPSPTEPCQVLTTAELRVLSAISSGQNPKDIAAQTGRSVHTVRTLVQRAIEKLGCSGRQQAIAEARRRGLLEEVSTQESRR